jgi:hypothetical protein
MIEADMRRSVQLATPRPSIESLIKRLHIPKARQKELRAMMDEARARLASEKLSSGSDAVKQEEKLCNASAAR